MHAKIAQMIFFAILASTSIFARTASNQATFLVLLALSLQLEGSYVLYVVVIFIGALYFMTTTSMGSVHFESLYLTSWLVDHLMMTNFKAAIHAIFLNMEFPLEI